MKVLGFLLLLPILLHAGWLDWLYNSEPSATQFECPYECGKWGSESIYKVEWLGVQALYEFDKMGHACRGEPFPYVHLPINEKDPWYLNAYLRQIEIRMFTNHAPIKGCWRAHHLNNRKSSYGCCCKGFKSAWLQGWEIHQIADEEKGKRGTMFRWFFDPNEPEDPKYDFTHEKGFSQIYEEEIDFTFDCSKDVLLFCNTSNMNYYFLEERNLLENAHLSYVRFIRKELELQKERKEKKLDEYQNILCSDPSLWIYMKSQYEEWIVNLKREIKSIQSNLQQIEEEEEGNIESERKRYDAIFSAHMPLIRKQFSAVLEEYITIFDQCIAEHQAPASYLERSRIHYEQGNSVECIEDIKKLFEVCPAELISENLSSGLELKKGTAECEVGLFDEAILTLSTYMANHPHYSENYLERAIAYFETGDFQSAIADFAESGLSPDSIYADFKEYLDFSSGMIKGITTGAGECLENFFPSMLSSVSGLSHGLWAFVTNPKEVSRLMHNAFEETIRFIKAEGVEGTLCSVFPELRELAVKGDQLSYMRQGELLGKMIGRHGLEFVLLAGVGKGVKTYRNLRKANAALTFKQMSVSARAEQILLMHQQEWNVKTSSILKGLQETKRLDKEIYEAFKNQHFSEHQIRQILHQAGFKTFPRPKGIPKNSTVQISKKNGGMVYIKAGTTEEQCLTIRVMPGNPTSPNPLQKNPYVVQRRGKEAVSKTGALVKKSAEEAHIPLTEFEFKGW